MNYVLLIIVMTASSVFCASEKYTAIVEGIEKQNVKQMEEALQNEAVLTKSQMKKLLTLATDKVNDIEENSSVFNNWPRVIQMFFSTLGLAASGACFFQSMNIITDTIGFHETEENSTGSIRYGYEITKEMQQGQNKNCLDCNIFSSFWRTSN